MDIRQDKNLEQQVLGCCLLSPRAFDAAIEEGLVVEDFYLESHRTILDAMRTVQQRLGAQEELDPSLVVAELGTKVDHVGGNTYVCSLPAAVPYVANVRQYVRELKDMAVARRVLAAIREVSEMDAGGEEMLTALQQRAFSLDHPKGSSHTMREAYQEIFLEAENPVQSTCNFPWREIDYYTRGLRPGWLTYIAGETRHGKTCCALSIADKALNDGKRVLFLSLEMSAFELGVRLAMRHGFNADGFYGKSRVSHEDFQALSDLIAQGKWDRMQVEMIENVGQAAAYTRRFRPDLVIVDYLQLLDIGKYGRVEGTTNNSRALKLMARKHEVPVVVLSQLSRAHRDDRGKPPGLWRLRDSGSIEQDADVVLFVWRKPLGDGEGVADDGQLIVAKARMGKTGKLDFLFNGATQTFIPIAKELAGYQEA